MLIFTVEDEYKVVYSLSNSDPEPQFQGHSIV